MKGDCNSHWFGNALALLTDGDEQGYWLGIGGGFASLVQRCCS